MKTTVKENTKSVKGQAMPSQEIVTVVKNEGINQTNESFTRSLQMRKNKVKDKKRNTTQQEQSNTKVFNKAVLDEFRKLPSAFAHLKKYQGFKHIQGQTFKPSIAYANLDLNSILYSLINEEKIQVNAVQKSLLLFDAKETTLHSVDVDKGQSIYFLISKWFDLVAKHGAISTNESKEIVHELISIVGLPKFAKGKNQGEINLKDNVLLFINAIDPKYITKSPYLVAQLEAIKTEQAQKELDKELFKAWKAEQK